MNPLEALKDEHRKIEMELMELEAVMEAEPINYPNLIHSFKKLESLWDVHEAEEEKIFGVMERENIRIPVEIITWEHKDLKKHKQGIKEAISSRDESKIKESFEKDLKIIILKIRDHINKEDEILYTAFLAEFTPEELEEMREAIKR